MGTGGVMLGYFGAETITVTLYDGTAGANVKGVWTPGTSTGVPLKIIAPQPVKASDMVNLADGEHISNYVRSWSADPLVTTRDGLKDADLITWDGKSYKVTQVDNRRTLGNYVRFIMKQVG